MPEVPERKVRRKEVRFDRYTEKVTEALMATGDFANEADMIRTAIHALYSKYESHSFPMALQSITERIYTGNQKPLTVTRWKSGKSKTTSKREEEESVEPV